MTSIIMQSTSGPDGKLHLEVPVGQADTEFEAEVVVRPKTTLRALPPDYFGLLGSIDDDTLTVHPQPPLPPCRLNDLFARSKRLDRVSSQITGLVGDEGEA